MKLVTLNVWGGRVEPAFSEFLDKYRAETDIFCFQEVFRKGDHTARRQFGWLEDPVNPNLLELISTKLPGYKPVFTPTVGEDYGIATFVKQNIEILDSGSVLIYENEEFHKAGAYAADHTRRFQWLKVSSEGKEFLVINIHGYWTNAYKGDSPERLKQSELLLEFIESEKLPVVLSGDFNVNPDTEAVAMLDKVLRNLVIENKVETTRTPLCPGRDKYPFADYVFVSGDLEIKDFKVLPEVASDHSGLLVEVA